ncbi:MAG: SpoIIE family protein phosphatase [Bacillota bacterium]|nr:SpoIIE family protein phosphatase [Bacillota bacterium]
MKQKQKQKLSTSFQKWLFALVLLAFLVTTAFLWVSQTQLAKKNALNILALNISDVYADIRDASDENILSLGKEIAVDLNQADSITSELLYQAMERYDVSEINYINENGIIEATTYPDFIGYDMTKGEQSAAFLVLLRSEATFAQPYGPVSFDASIQRKYGGVRLKNGGFVQVGYDAERFQKDIGKNVFGVTRNRHVGESGYMIIVDEDGNIVSDRKDNEAKHLSITGIRFDQKAIKPGEAFEATVYGEKSYCMYKETEGYLILAVMPVREAALSRNLSVAVTMGMELIVFVLLFIMIYFLVKRLVVRNIHKVNESLFEITQGNLQTEVNVRSHQEFEELSDDINATVGTLKKYIADAEARIDAELTLAKAIQHSALPSVFPPYPHRTEFDIWAMMDTAKEVGGDFYDFYFIDDETLAVLIADVSGKGIPAAMFMMTAKTLLKSYAESGMAVEEVFLNANEKLCENNDAGMFVTAWMGFLNTKTGKITYANAGHNPPMVKHADGSFTCLQSAADFVLAGMDGISYHSHGLQMEKGDILYLYTDGITEAINTEEELYGEDRLIEVLNRNGEKHTEAICAAVKADVERFTGEAEQFDDITMLALKYCGAEKTE